VKEVRSDLDGSHKRVQAPRPFDDWSCSRGVEHRGENSNSEIRHTLSETGYEPRERARGKVFRARVSSLGFPRCARHKDP
jgi:hypothetical protein